MISSCAGSSYFARHTTQDNVHARQMFHQAIEIEPEFGRAWAGLAYTHGFSYMYFNASETGLEAKRTSEKALVIAPDLAESHVSAGIAHCMSKAYEEAETEFEKAIEIDPKNYEAWYFFGRTKVHEGDLERALSLFERAAKVRPGGLPECPAAGPAVYEPRSEGQGTGGDPRGHQTGQGGAGAQPGRQPRAEHGGVRIAAARRD